MGTNCVVCTCVYCVCVSACVRACMYMCVSVCACVCGCGCVDVHLREGVRTICSGLLRWDDLGEMLCLYSMYIDIHILICLLASYCSLVEEK